MNGIWIAVAARLAVLLAALVALPQPASAGPEVPEGAYGTGAPSEPEGRAPLVRASLLVDAAVVAAGEPVRLGVLLEIEPEWHLYWRNSGEAGLETKIAWQAESTEFSPLLWPAPHVFREANGEITTYGYGDEVLLRSDAVFAPEGGSPRAVRATVDFLVCKVRCIPGTIELERDLVIGATSLAGEPATHELFERYAALLPVAPEELGIQLEAVYSQSAIRPGDEFRAGISVVDCDGGPAEACGRHSVGTDAPADGFVPDTLQSVKLKVTGARPHPLETGAFVVTLTGRATPDDPGDDQRLRGVLTVRGPEGVRYVDVDLPFPRAREGAEVAQMDLAWLAAEPLQPELPLWRAIALGLLGGLVLNLMPCVLPVLAIKAFGLVELAHRSRSQVLAHGGAYTLGILSAMAVLAFSVVALRTAGVEVGWGFQFQEPLFVVAISAVLVVFALNLFGVFELSFDATRLVELEQSATGLRKSFLEGLLAVVVATPCSAPFLGTAVGFAFASSTVLIFAIFAAIGLGLAAPYVLLTLVPGWARLLPRGGAWMDRLRAVLGFALLATVIWLVSVMGDLAGSGGLIALLALLLALSFATWLFGSLQGGDRARLGAVAAVLVAALASAAFLQVPLDAPQAADEEPIGGDEKVFEPAAVQAAVQAGRPVFVYFTADWCLTCKVNERVVLSTDGVRGALERLGVATFKADWTRRDDLIRRELARFGRAGVPLYLVYSPRAPAEPELLPELLTVDMVVDALEKAASPTGRT
jgi:thiol:disulfide interchange protein/DsbC/DsbD-like thiol-disulfide interchange protein